MNEKSETCSTADDQIGTKDVNSAIGKDFSETSPADFSGLLVIDQLRNCQHQEPTKLFITYSNPLTNESEVSTSTADSKCIINYLKQFSVELNESFLSRVQGNYLELRLCQKINNNENRIIASTKLPLHQFFIAFRDEAMIKHLSSNALPNISFDFWSDFVSVDSNEIFCQGKILLAIGTQPQIKQLRQQRGFDLKNNNQAIQETTKSIEQDPNKQLKNKLTAFIESLSTKLPDPTLGNNDRKAAPVQSFQLPAAPSQLRKTSDLLESLQKALSQPAPPQNPGCSSLDSAKVNFMITISNAIHLPKVIKKKQNRRKNKNSAAPQKTEFEPSAYVTFESCLQQLNESSLPAGVVKSHEGFVHCTSVVKSCDPSWNQNFNVHVPLDVLKNPQKRFIVKVWRKVVQDPDMLPAPFEDAVIGFSAIDLSPMLSGPPMIDGIFNIVDFSGNNKGQIKLNLKLVEVNQQPTPSNTLMAPLNIDVAAVIDEPSNILSRTLKRKFTELDEISQRLKARLFDVTGDENFDPDDEFERDLNTSVDEMDDDSMSMQQDFAWLKNDSNGATNDFQAQLNQFLESQPSTSKINDDIKTSDHFPNGSTSRSLSVDHLMEKFGNILETRPTSQNFCDDKNNSSIFTSQVQTIQNALQNASLADANGDQNLSTKKLDE